MGKRTEKKKKGSKTSRTKQGQTVFIETDSTASSAHKFIRTDKKVKIEQVGEGLVYCSTQNVFSTCHNSLNRQLFRDY